MVFTRTAFAGLHFGRDGDGEFVGLGHDDKKIARKHPFNVRARPIESISYHGT